MKILPWEKDDKRVTWCDIGRIMVAIILVSIFGWAVGTIIGVFSKLLIIFG